MNRFINFAAWSFCALIAVGVIGGAYLIWSFCRPPFPLKKLDLLHSSMTTNDVGKILGTPTSAWTRTNSLGQPYAEWAYSKIGSWSIVYLYFTPDGNFQSHRYDK